MRSPSRLVASESDEEGLVAPKRSKGGTDLNTENRKLNTEY